MSCEPKKVESIFVVSEINNPSDEDAINAMFMKVKKEGFNPKFAIVTDEKYSNLNLDECAYSVFPASLMNVVIDSNDKIFISCK